MTHSATIEEGAGATSFLASVERVLAGGSLVLMAGLPVAELLLRNLFGTGIPGAIGYVQNLTLWVGFLGAVVASRLGQHITISAGTIFLPARFDSVVQGVVAFVSAFVAAALAWAGYEFVVAEMDSPQTIAGWLPVYMAATVLPLCFALTTLRFILDQPLPAQKIAAVAGVAAAAGLIYWPEIVAMGLAWPLIAVFVLTGLFGAPIFVVLGGVALVLFLGEDLPVAAIPVETYRIIVSPTIPTIPLFALAGYILAEGGASKRLVRLFHALFSSLPGGMAIATILVCAFFSTFTGASGITIVALGGLLLPVLLDNGYPERFSIGLLTSTGSIGLLFPPSLAVILYAVIAKVPIPDMFIAGILPGVLLVAVVCIYAIARGVRSEGERPDFDLGEALEALWDAKWIVLLPVIAIAGIFGGIISLAEAAAVTAVYAFVMEAFIYRELSLTRDFPRAVIKCVTLIGAVFIILGVAMGLTNYLVDVDAPARATEWVKGAIESPITFLIALNLFLIVVGCLMDVFSAIVVVVPLILPISQAFGIHPLHLGIIFLVNLELGYLTPPVGMNLFLSSMRFERPLMDVARSALPFLGVLLAVLLLVTYVPWLTLAFVG